MRFTLNDDAGMRRSLVCWRAILAEVDQWNPSIPAATLEARFDAEKDELEFTLLVPGFPAKSTIVDASWIAYPDQADHLALATRRALRQLERIESRHQSILLIQDLAG